MEFSFSTFRLYRTGCGRDACTRVKQLNEPKCVHWSSLIEYKYVQWESGPRIMPMHQITNSWMRYKRRWRLVRITCYAWFVDRCQKLNNCEKSYRSASKLALWSLLRQKSDFSQYSHYVVWLKLVRLEKKSIGRFCKAIITVRRISTFLTLSIVERYLISKMVFD